MDTNLIGRSIWKNRDVIGIDDETIDMNQIDERKGGEGERQERKKKKREKEKGREMGLEIIMK